MASSARRAQLRFIAYGLRHPVLVGVLVGTVTTLWGALLFRFRPPQLWFVVWVGLCAFFWFLVRPDGPGARWRERRGIDLDVD